MTRSFRLVVNPNAGRGDAPQLAEEGRSRIRQAGFEEVQQGGDEVVLFGGDGTLHDYLNGSSFDPRASLVLVPCGTANALYASHHGQEDIWRSLTGALAGDKSALRPLPLALIDDKTTACVVVSAALHASILYDSEALRKAHPGIERFKMAAEQNLNRVYPGKLKLEGDVRRYSPAKKAFLAGTPEVELDGPFSYVLLGALTDRLEPTFVVAPLRYTDLSPGLDVVVIRRSASDDRFAERVLMPVTKAMYDEGKHIDLVYDGTDVRPFTPEDESLETVVDYFRCSRAHWTPGEASDVRSRLLCIDGFVQEIPHGRSVSVTTRSDSPSIWLGRAA